MIIRVPIDDTHTWAVDYFAHRFPPGVEVPVQKTVPVHYPALPTLDAHGHPVWPDMDVTGMQDMVMWQARGTIADRSTEVLGEGEEGIILHRQLMEENIRRVERGEDPIGVFRDPASNVCIRVGDDAENDKRIERPGRLGNASAPRPDRYDPVAEQIEVLAESAVSAV
jgi:5,5'-dehydrodivanillate O-demethylase